MIKYEGLQEKVLRLAEDTKNKDILYAAFEHFKKIYRDLKEETYRRYCRNAINDIPKKENINNENNIIDIKSNKNLKIVKRIAIAADFHCGHYAGVTPPQWQVNIDNEYYGHYAELQKKSWNWLVESINEVKKERKIDILLVNGDTIDGRGEKSGSTELIITDRFFQIKMAEEFIRLFEADIIRMTYGTPYHTGKEEDYELILADNLGAKIYDNLEVMIENIKFNLRHHISGSNREQSKATALLNTIIDDQLESARKGVEKSDIIIRSHRHKFVMVKDDYATAMVTPCLQLSSKYGGRKCSGIDIDYGFVIIDIYENGKVDIKPIIADIKVNHVNIEKL